MATILLSAAGQAVGSLFGPLGSIAGRALGAVAGSLIDRALIRSTLPTTVGPRLSDLTVQTSTEGASIPRVYGRVRLSGAIIWATNYEEETQRQSGGKGGPTIQTYKYYANFAIGLCEGPISRVSRVWADGVELDLTTVQMRAYLGDDDQTADSLILARQPGGVPAYRGLAYVVFERLPLDSYGNRIPVLSFEVIRVVDTLEARVRAVTLIPGSTEFGYATADILSSNGSGAGGSENRHVLTAGSDIKASLDDLQALCPNLQRVALVVSWFGDDLRAGSCSIAPRVDNAGKSTSQAWSVAGLTRDSARVVSSYGGGPAYGGSPSDASVIAAITELKARGLKVTLYPFIVMDIPAGNSLPDPYGGSRQAAYPWRGRITCHPAAGQSGSPDKTSAAASQVTAFVGTVGPGQFSAVSGGVGYSGPVEWSFRRMILHYATLAAAAGGVDAFLIGSELRGLSWVRSAASTYPFVNALVSLAADVKSVVGSVTKVSYGADWSEWFGHQPADGSGDVYFHLDPLWSCSSIDLIGIDTYVPLADWRYWSNLDAGTADSPWDLGYLRGNVLGGEGYDWYYASDAARRAQTRTPITDGAYGEPWIYRFKDLPSWWQAAHHDRPHGVRSATATNWVPRSKPIWLTEAGCAAVDLGANQPNVFPDPKSSESALPWFSRGARDDLMQRRYCEALLSAWDSGDPDHVSAAARTTTSGVPMLDPANVHLWTWDARPFPAFPAFADVWADVDNWRTGHWLTGRLGGGSVDALIRAIMADHGLPAPETQAIGGALDGYVIDSTMSVRNALEPLITAFQIDAIDTGTSIRFAGRARQTVASFTTDDIVDPGTAQVIELRRGQETELPLEVSVTVSDVLRDHHRTTVTSRRLTGASARVTRADLAAVMPVEVAVGLADQWLHDIWVGRELAHFALPPQQAAFEPGDIVALAVGSGQRRFIMDRITDGASRAIEAHAVDPSLYGPVPADARDWNANAPVAYGPPTIQVLDIAHRDEVNPAYQPYLAAFADPWPVSLSLWRQASGGGSYSVVASTDRRATLGQTLSTVAPGPLSRWDEVTAIDVRILGGHLVSLPDAQVLAGGNLAAIRNSAGLWEIFQFASAVLTGSKTYRLTRLLRGQGGSEDAWSAPIPAGSPFVLLDTALLALPIGRDDIGLPLTFRLGSARDDYTAPSYATFTLTPTGRGLLPWSPSDLKAIRNGISGDVTVSWARRSRVPGADVWSPGDVPLGEDTEAYRLRILSGSSVVRQVDVGQPTYLYTAAQQTADFGSRPASLSVSVAQISTALGPGVWRTATLTP